MENIQQEADLIKCPKCNSTQITAGKHGFNAGKAIGGALLTGGIGLLAGMHGSKRIEITCLNCGHKFKPGSQLKKEPQKNKLAVSPQPAPTKINEKDGDKVMGCLVILVLAVIIYYIFSR